VKDILGDRSPQWSAVKQGLFSRVVESGEGVTAFGPGKVAQRINKFLNVDGKEMAAQVYTKTERDLIQKYGDLMRHLEVPQAGANWSNTSSFAAKSYVGDIGNKITMRVAGALGHLSGIPLAGEAAGALARKLATSSEQAREAREIARMMPILRNVMRDYQIAVQAAEQSRTPRNIARLTIASRNLANNLPSLGINLSADDLMQAIQGSPGVPAEGSGKSDRLDITMPRRRQLTTAQ
jgi:hypothetical protein